MDLFAACRAVVLSPQPTACWGGVPHDNCAGRGVAAPRRHGVGRAALERVGWGLRRGHGGPAVSGACCRPTAPGDCDPPAGGRSTVSSRARQGSHERTPATVGSSGCRPAASSVLAGRLAAGTGLGLGAHPPVPLQTAPLPLGGEWAASPRPRLRHREGRRCEALVSGHDGAGLGGCAGRSGLGGAFSPGGWLP